MLNQERCLEEDHSGDQNGPRLSDASLHGLWDTVEKKENHPLGSCLRHSVKKRSDGQIFCSTPRAAQKRLTEKERRASLVCRDLDCISQRPYHLNQILHLSTHPLDLCYKLFCCPYSKEGSNSRALLMSAAASCHFATASFAVNRRR